MILNYEEVKKQSILTNTVEENYNNAVYDIRVGKIITIKGNEVENYEIPPQGMVVVVSQEDLVMPSDIVGYAHVRTGLSSKGIMAINIGIIDPGYSGKLASTLLNFGKESYKIKAGDKFLRTTFHSLHQVEVNKPSTGKSMDDSNYLVNKKFEASKYMDEKFLSLDREVSNAINSRFDYIAKYASSISVIIAATALTITIVVFLLNNVFSFLKNNPTEGYEYQLKVNQAKYELLEKENSTLKKRIDSIALQLRKTNSSVVESRVSGVKSTTQVHANRQN